MKPVSKAPTPAQANVSRIVKGLLGFRAEEQRELAPVLGITASGVSEKMVGRRNRFGTRVYRSSRDIRLTQELLGHASPVTTASYAAWDQDAAAAVIDRLD